MPIRFNGYEFYRDIAAVEEIASAKHFFDKASDFFCDETKPSQEMIDLFDEEDKAGIRILSLPLIISISPLSSYPPPPSYKQI